MDIEWLHWDWDDSLRRSRSQGAELTTVYMEIDEDLFEERAGRLSLDESIKERN